MNDLGLSAELRAALEDLADATGRSAEEVAAEAVRRYVAGERGRVLGVAERLGGAHAGLLKRLGE
ncbi:hypothetical protein IAG44_25405 [Streptomyces roseirectus]|uniref:Ribbon-helix-helix protein CopG domain-containing protein n=1 Tax=Streptomyces roseirectus TaxID=2768066 RepID=A0A7H0II10_9ACTN|nr:hypothetical protein [Streptomyces roseirectus]QNP72426.1 hypothetical protein IAG44_25405 [Streptomyces roseirectus]